jgi:hypothetical protein
MDQRRIEKAVAAQEEQLAAVLGQEVGRRSRMTEKAMIGRTVFAKNMLQSTPSPTQSHALPRPRPTSSTSAEHSWTEKGALRS